MEVKTNEKFKRKRPKSPDYRGRDIHHLGHDTYNMLCRAFRG